MIYFNYCTHSFHKFVDYMQKMLTEYTLLKVDVTVILQKPTHFIYLEFRYSHKALKYVTEKQISKLHICSMFMYYRICAYKNIQNK